MDRRDTLKYYERYGHKEERDAKYEPPSRSELMLGEIIKLLKIQVGVSEEEPEQPINRFDIASSITAAVPNDPLNPESSDYTTYSIHDDLGRRARKLTMSNDGPGTLYIIVSHEKMVFSDELALGNGETKTYDDVYEIKLRSPTVDLKYRITEYTLDSYIAIMKGEDASGDLVNIVVDADGNLVAVMKGDFEGTLLTLAVDSEGLMQADVSKSEKISIIETDKDVHFTGAITQFNQETENLTSLTDNRIFIRGINAQSKQKLKYRLTFWTKDTFEDTDINVDSYIDDVILDFTDDNSTFRINNANQYYLNISDLGILYEDDDSTNEIHCSLQNLSATSKNAGATGEIQIDIKYAPRL